jgi:hypothetical protein
MGAAGFLPRRRLYFSVILLDQKRSQPDLGDRAFADGLPIMAARRPVERAE